MRPFRSLWTVRGEIFVRFFAWWSRLGVAFKFSVRGNVLVRDKTGKETQNHPSR